MQVVRSRPRGSELNGDHDGSGTPLTTLTIEDTRDFDDVGGQIVIGAGGLREVLTYTAVSDDAKTLTLDAATPLTGTFLDGEPVLVYPRENVSWGDMQQDDAPGGLVRVRVPSQHQRRLRPGTREDTDRESVAVVADNDPRVGWRVEEVRGDDPGEQISCRFQYVDWNVASGTNPPGSTSFAPLNYNPSPSLLTYGPGGGLPYYDDGGFFYRFGSGGDPDIGYLLIPVDGLYAVSAQVFWEKNADGDRYFDVNFFQENGEQPQPPMLYDVSRPAPSGWCRPAPSTVLPLLAQTALSPHVGQTSGVSLEVMVELTVVKVG